MITVDKNIYHIQDNLYYIPYLSCIIETSPNQNSINLTKDNTNNVDQVALGSLESMIESQSSSQHILRPDLACSAEIILTERCNLQCKYCYSGGYRSNRTISKEFIHDIIEKLFQNAVTYNNSNMSEHKEVYILFHGGGEPTLAWDELCYAITLGKSLSVQYKTQLRFNLASNGIIPASRLEHLIDNGFMFRISLDGIGEMNDLTRQTPTEESSFPLVAQTLDRLNESNNRFIIAAVVTPDNISQMENFIKAATCRWDSMYDFRFFMLEETELTEKNHFGKTDPRLFQRNYYTCIDYMIKNEFGRYKKFISLNDYILRTHKGSCAPSIMNMPVYNSNGDILRCNAHVFDESAKIGYYHDKLIYESKRYLPLFNSLTAKKESCESCICNTHCEFSSNTCVKPISPPIHYCNYMNDTIRHCLIESFNNPSLISNSVVYNNVSQKLKKVVHWKS